MRRNSRRKGIALSKGSESVRSGGLAVGEGRSGEGLEGRASSREGKQLGEGGGGERGGGAGGGD